VVSLQPKSGPLTGGTNLTIYGTFYDTHNLTVVFDDGISQMLIPYCTFVSNSSLMCTTPPFNSTVVGSKKSYIVRVSVDNSNLMQLQYSVDDVSFMVYPLFSISSALPSVLSVDNIAQKVEIVALNMNFIGTGELKYLISSATNPFPQGTPVLVERQAANYPNYVRSFQVNNSQMLPLYNVRVRVLINTVDLIPAKLLADCSNFRVRNELFTEDVSHWLEPDTCNSTQSVLWIFLPILNESEIVHVVYGDADMPSIQDPKAVFDFYSIFLLSNTCLGFIHLQTLIQHLLCTPTQTKCLILIFRRQRITLQ